jgi:UDP-glucose 4-epimerase
MKKNAIVFGGVGFLGSAVAKELAKSGFHVTVFDLHLPKAPIDDVNYIQGDILRLDEVKLALKGNSIVYNFAGAANLEDSVNDPLRYLNLNILGNANILQSAAETDDIKRFVYASSAYALSDKGAFYGTSKRASEKITQIYQRNFGIDYTILRYGSVYGPNADSSNRIFRFIKEALEKGSISFPGDGSEEREYIHVQDAAKLSVEILEPFGKNQSFILTGTERFTYKEVLGFLSEIIGPEVKIEMQGSDYKGHYSMTPYEFDPDLGKKLINNPSIDFGQGILQCVQKYHQEMKK